MNTSGPVRNAAAFHELVRAWEQAYRDYMAAWEHGSAVLSPTNAQNTASAAQRVSRAWHELAKSRGLPWWCVAALESAAEGFEELAKEWAGKAGRHDGQLGRARRDVDRRAGSGTDGRGDWFGPDASADAGARGGAVRGDAAAAGRPGDVAGMRDVPS